MNGVISAVLACIPCAVLADIVPLSPVGGETVRLLPDGQRAVLRLGTFEERRAHLQCKVGVDGWRSSRPVHFRWRVTAGESGHWRLRVGTRADLSDAEEAIVAAETNLEGLVEAEFPRLNPKVGETFYWTVSAGCCQWTWASVEDGEGEIVPWKAQSSVACFRTEDVAPRWIAIEGRVGNIRDMGGRVTEDGHRVRQGLIFRGEGLNDNSMDGVRPGRNRLMEADVDYLTCTLGIRTDLDLRTTYETANMTMSPLGTRVKYVHHSSEMYAGLFTPKGKEIMARNFRLFCDRENFPIYFHCIAGADRTGSLAYVLNGVLGVVRRELETDWESTFYPEMPDEFFDLHGRSESHFDKGFSRYGTADMALRDRIALYLKDCGITDEELGAFRSIMLTEGK